MQKRNNPALVLVTSRRDPMKFQFPSSQLVFLISIFAIAAGLAILFQGAELSETSLLSDWFLWFLEVIRTY